MDLPLIFSTGEGSRGLAEEKFSNSAQGTLAFAAHAEPTEAAFLDKELLKCQEHPSASRQCRLRLSQFLRMP